MVGRTKRSAVPAIGQPAGTALRLVRPTNSTPICWLDKPPSFYPEICNRQPAPPRICPFPESRKCVIRGRVRDTQQKRRSQFDFQNARRSKKKLWKQSHHSFPYFPGFTFKSIFASVAKSGIQKSLNLHGSTNSAISQKWGAVKILIQLIDLRVQTRCLESC